MAVMTGAEWKVTRAKGKSVQICHGDLCSTLDFGEANEFALSILKATGYRADGATNYSKTATSKPPKGKPKGGMKGGKSC